MEEDDVGPPSLEAVAVVALESNCLGTLLLAAMSLNNTRCETSRRHCGNMILILLFVSPVLFLELQLFVNVTVMRVWVFSLFLDLFREKKGTHHCHGIEQE